MDLGGGGGVGRKYEGGQRMEERSGGNDGGVQEGEGEERKEEGIGREGRGE